MKKIDIQLSHRLGALKGSFARLFQAEFGRDHAVQIILFASVVMLLSSWIVGFLRFLPSDYDVPLRYDSFLGVTRLGKWYELYRVPFIGTLALGINYYLGSLLYGKDKMLGYILLGATFFVSLLTLLVTINLGILVK
jgi:hypothetical protein